ncbi:MAG: hypothetical protein ABR953_09255 [Candidatus Acidiferrales bacterium]
MTQPSEQQFNYAPAARIQNPLASGSTPALTESARFVRAHWLKFVAVSCLALVPCFWHRRIGADDLGSHVYNAWLAHLIRHGQAPGLWIAPQWTNVLFDFLLSRFGSVFGFAAAERIAVALAVLIFFWGAFALTCAAARQAPWFVLPCLALATYGYTFYMGFFNYYLSLGLAFFSLAIFWRGKGWERLVAIAILPFVGLAHPLGLIWVIGACIYVGFAEMVRPRYQVVLLVAASAGLVVAHYYLGHRFIVEPAEHSSLWFSGADQLVLFGDRYWIPAVALIVFAIMSPLVDIVRRWRDAGSLAAYSIPLQFYLLAAISIPLLPRGIHLSPHLAPIALLTERLTSVSAVLFCCLLGAMRPSKWHLLESAAIAAVFFAFLYRDTAVVSRMEAQAERLVRTLPPNCRVMGTIKAPPDSRILIQHMIDRACVGYCFSYGNYEPGSRVFRVRAMPGNPYVLTDYDLAADTEDGDYTVQQEDLPLYQVYQCSESGTDLCIRPLEAGETNDRLGVHPDD